MTDIFVAPKKRHCDPPDDRPLGSIWRCGFCGRYLYAFDTDGCAPPSSIWTPVRWWNFRARRLIREAQRR